MKKRDYITTEEMQEYIDSTVSRTGKPISEGGKQLIQKETEALNKAYDTGFLEGYNHCLSLLETVPSICDETAVAL